MLRLASIIFGSALLAALPADALAQAPAPYPVVAVTLPEPPSDPAFSAFRHELARVAKGRVYAELARMVELRGFFWERDFRTAFAPARSGVENLSAAIGLERGGGEGWMTLARFAAEPTATPLASRPETTCAPARPQFDEAEYYGLIGRTGTEAEDWAYPLTAGVTMRASADPSGTVLEMLGRHFLRLPAHAGKNGEDNSAPAGWRPVVAPSGKSGFVASGLLRLLSAERLCYRKDVTGRWRITGFIGGGD